MEPEMYVRVQDACPPKYQKTNFELSKSAKAYLNRKNIRLYTHQAEAYDRIISGENVILTTPTASGKTLAYALPVFEKLKQNPEATAVFLYPTKALTRDQLIVLQELDLGLGAKTRPAIYDGDTPKEARARIRKSSRVILTNMYELHLILAWRMHWGDFWTNLTFTVIDEAHRYRGIFGSHTALLIRRLRRVCRFYDANPNFILSSATLANGKIFAETLTGVFFSEIFTDGSPRAKQTFQLYNPVETGKSTVSATADLMKKQIREGMQTLCFTKSRNMAEITALKCREEKSFEHISSYRGGYRPSERRAIEGNLKTGKTAGVVSTNALEVGIDVGGLDSVIISGFPGSMISVRQQAGRAGRSGKEAVITFIAQANPIDQYFMKNPEAFFEASQEHAILDLNNPYILKSHLLCAAAELPYRTERDAEFFGEAAGELISCLKEEHLIASTPKGFVFCGSDSPASKVSLSGTNKGTWSVMQGKTVLETMDSSQAYREGYPGAIIFHQGERFRVEGTDSKNNIIRVVKTTDPYYTRPLHSTEIRINARLKTHRHGGLILHFGDVTVSTKMHGYSVLEYDEIVATNPLDLSPMEFTTKACWFTIDGEYLNPKTAAGSLHGCEHSLIAAVPIHVLCDRSDIGGVSTPCHFDTGEPTIFIYDGYEGGVGLAEKSAELFPDILKLAHKMVTNCSCESGCPSCIHSSKCGNNNQPLSKDGTKALLEKLIAEMSDENHEYI